MLTVSETAELLRSFDRVLILTHIRPDGDTVGCAAGLCAALRALGKTAFLLPNPGLTDTTAPYFAPYAAPAEFTPEKVLSVDIAAVGLFPDNAQKYLPRVDLAIDHHPSQEFFAQRTCLDAGRAACGELMYDILRLLGPVTADIATPLYVAVSTDCGCFVYGNTTAATHRVAADLIDCGIPLSQLNKRHFRTKSIRRLRLEKGYSVKELQEYLGLGCPQGVYQWQAGRSLPSVDNLYAVSRLWGVSMNEILVERESA